MARKQSRIFLSDPSCSLHHVSAARFLFWNHPVHVNVSDHLRRGHIPEYARNKGLSALLLRKVDSWQCNSSF
jgi:hypothetical protein